MIPVLLLLLVPVVGALAVGVAPLRAPARVRVVLGCLALELGLALAATVGPTAPPASILDLELTLAPASALVLAATLAAGLVATLGLRERLARRGGVWLLGGMLGAVVAIVGTRSLATSGMGLALGGTCAVMLLAEPAESSSDPSESLPDARGGPAGHLILWFSLAGALFVLADAFDRLEPGIGRPGSGVDLGGISTALVLVGIGIGLGALPLFPWTIQLGERAPGFGALVLAILGGSASGILLPRLSTSAWRFDAGPAHAGLLLVGAAGAVLAVLAALSAKHPGGVLAALAGMNASLILAALALGAGAASSPLVWLLVVQILAVSLAFAALAGLGRPGSGASRRRPILGLSLGVAIATLLGLPPTAGFVGRVLLARATGGSLPIVLLAVAVASVLGGLAAVRAFAPLVDRAEVPVEPVSALDVGAALIALALLVGGIAPAQILDLWH